MNFFRPQEIQGANWGILFIRVAVGLSLIINHGWPTVASIMSGNYGYPDPLGIGAELSMILMGFTELLGGILILLGLGFRPILIAMIIGFSVAFFVHHGGEPWSKSERAFLYLSITVMLFFTGPGKYSIDRHIFKRAKSSAIKNLLILIMCSLLAYSFNVTPKDKTLSQSKNLPQIKGEEAVLGIWKRIELAYINEQGKKIVVKKFKNPKIKMFGNNNFMFGFHKGDIFQSAGGTYAFDGKHYRPKVEFHYNKEAIGSVSQFELKVQGDTLYQLGTENTGYLHEIYVREDFDP